MPEPVIKLCLNWQIEQRRRWQAGDRVFLERFLEEYPEVAAQEDHLINLIYSELRLRESLGETPHAREYEQRFPNYARQMRSLFAMHAAIISAGSGAALRAIKDAVDTIDYSAAESREARPDFPVDFVSSTTQPLSLGTPSSPGLRFRVLRPHARGGLGEVFVAFDEELHREVALKQIQSRYADHLERRARFIAEAEITGGLEHPGIVPVYGLGSYENGRPFYAMRFIRGESLKSAIDRFHTMDAPQRDPSERSLELRKLLSRMIDVCDAMEYAHSRGVLHRDLKPANIMVGKFGETLVVDWGLAKTLGSSEAPTLAVERPLQLSSRSDSGETKTGSAIGTAQYMSPEQAAGRADLISTATDVYCLGSTLYHLLAGKPPLESKEVSDILARISTGNFPRPRAVKPSVPPPLEAICLKAMTLEPAQRYQSARLLADDIEHWMADEPVTAYQESHVQRAGRWMRKHRSWTLAAAFTLLSVSLVSILAALVVNEARRNETIERQKAQTAFRQSRDTMDTWLTGAGEVLKYYPDLQNIRKGLLERAVIDYKRLAEQHNDTSVEIEQGRSQVRLGDVYRLLGEFKLSENAYLEGERLFEILIVRGQELGETQVERANAKVKRALLLAETGHRPEADQEYAAAIRGLKESSSMHVVGERAHEALGTALFNHAALQSARGNHAEAIHSLSQALDEFAAAWVAAPKAPRARFDAALAIGLWGECLARIGQYQAAAPKFESALADLESLVRDAANEPEYMESKADLRVSMAAIMRQLGKYGEELDCYRRAVADYQALDKALPHAPSVLEGLARTRMEMGQLLHHLGETSLAEIELNLALPVFKELQEAFPEIPRFREEAAATQDTLGQVFSDLERNDLSRSAHEHAIEACRTLLEEFPGEIAYQERQAICRSHLGQVLHKLGALDEAQGELRAAIAMLDALGSQKSEAVDAACFARIHLGDLLLEMDDRAGAVKTFTQAHADWEKLVSRFPYPEYQDHLAWSLANCADPALRDCDKAARVAQQAVQQAPENASYLATLAAAKYRQADFDRTLSILEHLKQLRDDYHGREWFFWAMALWKTGAHDAALEAIKSGQQWSREHMPGNAELLRLEEEAVKTTQGMQ